MLSSLLRRLVLLRLSSSVKDASRRFCLLRCCSCSLSTLISVIVTTMYPSGTLFMTSLSHLLSHKEKKVDSIGVSLFCVSFAIANHATSDDNFLLNEEKSTPAEIAFSVFAQKLLLTYSIEKSEISSLLSVNGLATSVAVEELSKTFLKSVLFNIVVQ